MRANFRLSVEQEAALDRAGDETFNGDYVDPRTGEVKVPNPVFDAWAALGRELGFDPDTVKFNNPDADSTDYDFTAEVV